MKQSAERLAVSAYEEAEGGITHCVDVRKGNTKNARELRGEGSNRLYGECGLDLGISTNNKTDVR